MKTPVSLITSATAMLAGISFASSALAEEVNIYSSRHYDSDQALYDAFTEATGIEVNVLEGDSDQLIQRIKREGEASPADVMITVDAARLWRAEQEGIYASVDSEVLNERIPDSLRHPDGKWFGFSQRVRAIFYNPDAIDPTDIATYEDLADPRFEGAICIRSSSNVYNQSLLASIIAHDGEEEAEAWAQGVADNLARDPAGGDRDQIRGVASGECDLAVANRYYYVRMLNAGDEADRAAAEKVEILFPNQDGRGAHVNIGGAGMVEGAPNPENAVRFLEFLASDEAQRLFVAGNYELPAVEGVQVDGQQPPLSDFKRDEINVSQLGTNNPEAIRIFDRVGWR